MEYVDYDPPAKITGRDGTTEGFLRDYQRLYGALFFCRCGEPGPQRRHGEPWCGRTICALRIEALVKERNQHNAMPDL